MPVRKSTPSARPGAASSNSKKTGKRVGDAKAKAKVKAKPASSRKAPTPAADDSPAVELAVALAAAFGEEDRAAAPAGAPPAAIEASPESIDQEGTAQAESNPAVELAAALAGALVGEPGADAEEPAAAAETAPDHNPAVELAVAMASALAATPTAEPESRADEPTPECPPAVEPIAAEHAAPPPIAAQADAAEHRPDEIPGDHSPTVAPAASPDAEVSSPPPAAVLVAEDEPLPDEFPGDHSPVLAPAAAAAEPAPHAEVDEPLPDEFPGENSAAMELATALASAFAFESVAEAEAAAIAAAPPPLERLSEVFQLSVDEQRVLSRLLAAAEPQTVAQLAAALDVELVPLLLLLAGDGALRAHALVEVDEGAELGFLRPTDRVYPARGLELLTGDGRAIPDAVLFCGQAPGVTHLPAPQPGTEWARDLLPETSAPGPQSGQISELVRDRLVAPHPILLWLSHCPPDAVLNLCQASRLRLQRPVVLLSALSLSGCPTPQVSAALRRLRRDADLRGAMVVVSEAQLLGGAWQALAGPRPAGQSAPVMLCSSATLLPPGPPPASRRGGAALVPQVHALRAPAAPVVAAAAGAAGAAGTAASEPAVEDPATLASREEARRRAALDAARAMGKPIPPELLNAAASASAAAQQAAAQQALSAAQRPATPAPAPTPVAAAAPAAPSTPRPTNPRLAAALAKAGLPPAGGSAPPARAVAPQAAAEPPPPPPPAPSPDSAAAEPAPPDDQPPIPLADDANLEELLRVVRTTPNNKQRAEILRKLAGTKSPTVIQLFRLHAQSAHPDVRAAAEAGMASLFGANWNRTRAIAPPVQPPRSDDNGRGPGGAF